MRKSVKEVVDGPYLQSQKKKKFPRSTAPAWIDNSVKVLPPDSLRTCSPHHTRRNHPSNYTKIGPPYHKCPKTPFN